MRNSDDRTIGYMFALIATLVMIVALLSLPDSNDEEKIAEVYYCEMVDLFEATKGESGHPDYKKIYPLICTSNL